MIKGIGIDAVELSRIKPIVEKQGSFIQRVLTPNELTLFVKKRSLKHGAQGLVKLVYKILRC